MRVLKLGLLRGASSVSVGCGGVESRPLRTRLGALSLGLVGLSLHAASAHASGPVEALAGVQVDPENVQRLMVRYDNTGTKTGLLYSADGGQTFALLCTSAMAEEAIRGLDKPSKTHMADIRASLTRARDVTFVGDGKTLVATTGGLFIDDGKGCGFRDVPQLSQLWISGLAVSAHAPKVAYVLTNGVTEHDNEGLWRRDANGSFTHVWHSPTPPEGENWSNGGLVAGQKPGGGVRGLRTSTRLRKQGDVYVSDVLVLKSDDGGATFTEHAIDVPERASFSLLGIDPQDGNRVLGLFERVREGGSAEENEDTLLVSNDGGQTFSTLYTGLRSFSAATFAADGTLWVADSGSTASGGEGLWRFEAGLAQSPTRVLDKAVGCVAPAPEADQLYVCERYAFGRLDLTDESFTSLVDMWTVQSIHSCAGQDVVADCHDQLCAPGWCGPGHFATAPLCSAYDEPFCGNDADNYNNPPKDPGSNDGGVTDGGVKDPGSDDPDAEEPNADGGEPGAAQDGGMEAPAKAKKEDCSVHPGPSGQGSTSLAWFLTSLVAALSVRRNNRKKVP